GEDRFAATVPRTRYFGGDPAPCRDADLEDDRRCQQGLGGADLRDLRLRRRRGSVRRRAPADRRGQLPQELTDRRSGWALADTSAHPDRVGSVVNLASAAADHALTRSARQASVDPFAGRGGTACWHA